MLKKSIVAVILVGLLGPVAAAQNKNPNWPQFRGPGSLGVTEDTTLPETWSTRNVGGKPSSRGMGWMFTGSLGATAFSDLGR